MGDFLKNVAVLYVTLMCFFVKILIRTALRFRLCGSSTEKNGNEIGLARVSNCDRDGVLINT
jgi:hypothetical protein